MRNPGLRFLRGLGLGLTLSGLNLAGMFLMLLALGGLGAWSTTQFVGVFGIFEVATGIAFIYCPNAWRLPVIEVETGRTDVRLTASTLFIPHWAAGAKVLAGVAMVAYAASSEGLAPGSLIAIPFVIAVAVFTVAVSTLAAAWGIRNPAADVIYLKVERPERPTLALPGISITAATLQLVLGAFTLPTMKLLPPDSIYRPEFAPSAPLTVGAWAAAIVAVLLTLYAWRGRLGWRAKPEQQQMARQPA